MHNHASAEVGTPSRSFIPRAPAVCSLNLLKTTTSEEFVSLSRRLRAWFRGDSAPKATPRSGRSAKQTSSDNFDALVAFGSSRRGVECYVEPPTKMYSMSVLLVADDGEYLRRAVDGLHDATRLCERLSIPLYDAAKVGYPKRVRDYARGHRQPSISIEDLPPWPDGSSGPPQAPRREDTPYPDGPPPPPPPPSR